MPKRTSPSGHNKKRYFAAIGLGLALGFGEDDRLKIRLISANIRSRSLRAFRSTLIRVRRHVRGNPVKRGTGGQERDGFCGTAIVSQRADFQIVGLKAGAAIGL